MEYFDKIRIFSRCTHVKNLIDVASIMLTECRFDRDEKLIFSEETDRISKIQSELREIRKEVETLIKTL